MPSPGLSARSCLRLSLLLLFLGTDAPDLDPQGERTGSRVTGRSPPLDLLERAPAPSSLPPGSAQLRPAALVRSVKGLGLG